MYWSRTDSWTVSLIRELPPMATTAVRGSIACSSAHRQGHDGLLAVETVLCLVVDDRLRTVDDRVRHFGVPVGRQRVHEDRIVVGRLHVDLVGHPGGVPVDQPRVLGLVGG